MDGTGIPDPRGARIDGRILKHLLHEATELMEEAQTHALVERHNAATARVLTQANWRMTATCVWAIGELVPVPGESETAARLHAPAPSFSDGREHISPRLDSFVTRVNRLHERARRLDDLSRGPVVSTAPAPCVAEPARATGSQEPARVIPLFGGGNDGDVDPVGQARSHLYRAIGGID